MPLATMIFSNLDQSSEMGWNSLPTLMDSSILRLRTLLLPRIDSTPYSQCLRGGHSYGYWGQSRQGPVVRSKNRAGCVERRLRAEEKGGEGEREGVDGSKGGKGRRVRRYLGDILDQTSTFPLEKPGVVPVGRGHMLVVVRRCVLAVHLLCNLFSARAKGRGGTGG